MAAPEKGDGPHPDRPRVFTIPPGAPFLPTLADALLDGRLVPGFPDAADPLALARATIYLPTRRATRALAAYLAERLGPRPALLPRIRPLGDVDAAEFALADSVDFLVSDLPPAIPDRERRLILTALTLAWARRQEEAFLPHPDGLREPLLVPASPADAHAMAGDLAQLMDTLVLHDARWDSLHEQAEARFDRYFSITLHFLEIAARNWPYILAERGASDPSYRRDRLIRAEADRLAAGGAEGPVIAAGSTGSIPATARLLAAIARMPQGAVVLPGLDQAVADAVFDTLAGRHEADGEDDADADPDLSRDTHPQATLARLLPVLGATRASVEPLGEAPPALAARARLLGEAMRPAHLTDAWSDPAARLPEDLIGQGLDGLAVIVAADEREEALAIAVAIRETLETSGATAALVTPDRVLAERVAAELARWGIDADDSSGESLGRSPAGSFARLVAGIAADGAAPATMLALLAHPLFCAGLERPAMRRARAALEIGVLRGPAPPRPGLAGWLDVWRTGPARGEDRHAPLPLRRLTAEDWDLAGHVLTRIEAALAPLLAAGNGPEVDLVGLAAHHRAATEALACAVDGSQPLAHGPDGEGLADLFDELACAGETGLTGTLADYALLFESLAADCMVRRQRPRHRRVHIWGQLEARLLQADRIVLGGLDEGLWPGPARTDAFLNRPLRAALGLPSPERRIGQSAHDVVQLLGVRDAVITRALKRGDAPSVPSRWLQRLAAYAGDAAWKPVLARGEVYAGLARLLERPTPGSRPVARPEPRPPLARQPTRLRLTEIGTLIRDPYAVYARRVLRLEPLPGLAEPPGAAAFGTLVHAVLGRFAQDWPQLLPADAAQRLAALAEAELQPFAPFPEVLALWRPRLSAILDAYLAWERARRVPGLRLVAEIDARADLPVQPGPPLRLSGRADRLEIGADGDVAIVDFKTGQPASNRMVQAGLEPQLTLEAALLRRGFFGDLPPPSGSYEALYVKLGAQGSVQEVAIRATKDGQLPLDALADAHWERLIGLIGAYRSGARGYRSRAFPPTRAHAGDYDQLARVKEWSRTAGVSEPGADGEEEA